MPKETNPAWVQIGEHRLPQLNLPPFDANCRITGKRNDIKCLSRKKFVALEPEEWVRQHWLHHLSHDLNYPLGLISVEHPLNLHGMKRRADIICHDRQGKALLMVECKRHDVPLSKTVLDQILRYHLALKTQTIVISNGIQHQAYSFGADGFEALDSLSVYPKNTDK
jgi:hypothetical protein